MKRYKSVYVTYLNDTRWTLKDINKLSTCRKVDKFLNSTTLKGYDDIVVSFMKSFKIFLFVTVNKNNNGNNKSLSLGVYKTKKINVSIL